MRQFWAMADRIIASTRHGYEDQCNDAMRARIAADFQAQRSYLMQQDALGTKASS